jgi:2'-5' RNA ligase
MINGLLIYQKLWDEALAAFAKGAVQLDPHLANKEQDLRRGISIAIRPSPGVRQQVQRFTDQLTTICPGQYYYQPEELHVTLISLVSGSVAWRKEMHHLLAYRAIVRDVLPRQSVFKISFRGVTASPAAVMIQGFPENDALNQIREAIREAFLRRGFGATLDRRYKISTAHMTVLRFQYPPSNWQKLVTLLQENRATPFGETEVHRAELVWGDWYASAKTLRRLEEYQLGSASP